MASLTDNEDRVRAAEIPPGTKERLEQPGFVGIEARIYQHTIREFGIAMAREVDRGSPQEEIVAATARVAAGIIASAACGNSGEPMGVAKLLVADAARLAAEMVFDFATGNIVSTKIPINRPGRA